ncbi:hypothetical protein [Thalassomonas haliotis]|uniref:Uncharacterized protein n=1 Tax=Thalassomonas haliotis TaxID=485448 RepID=A0ABY7VGL1_9GAMM|nr:hypothetical protein [Thalassomonas haliotis]WDE12339.1 hypothetical protein H3N35_02305 [Thalassomonas haliotis]
MFVKKKISVLSLSLLALFSVSSNADDPVSLIDCGQFCNDIYSSVSKVVALEDYYHDDNMLFKLIDSGTEVNSITYQQYLANLNRPLFVKKKENMAGLMDASLSCENDSDFNCEAWNGSENPYLTAIENALETYNFHWKYVVTEADIESTNLKSKIAHAFISSAIASATFASLAAKIYKVSKTITNSSQLANALTAGTGGVYAALVYGSAVTTKLKAGDEVVIQYGKIIAVIRDGESFTLAQINAGSGSSTGGSSGGGTRNGDVGSGGTDIGNLPVLPYCYRTFSNGQVIKVPCP